MSEFRSGFVGLVGRPNAGKSTLLNALVGEKVAIVSNKPQTTRTHIRGVLSKPEGQIVFVDTPGIHRPGYELNRRMMHMVSEALLTVDVLLLLVDATARRGAGDRFAADMVLESGKPVFLILNKVDKLKNKSALFQIIEDYTKDYTFAEVVPISARTEKNVDRLVTAVFGYLPEGPRYFPDDEYTDQPLRTLAAELVREKILRATVEELPYVTAVIVERWEETETLAKVYCVVYVEKSSQKGIIIGKGGHQLKEIGTQARQDLEPIIGKQVFLQIHVVVREHWRDDPHALDLMGIERGETRGRRRKGRVAAPEDVVEIGPETDEVEEIELETGEVEELGALGALREVEAIEEVGALGEVAELGALVPREPGVPAGKDADAGGDTETRGDMATGDGDAADESRVWPYVEVDAAVEAAEAASAALIDAGSTGVEQRDLSDGRVCLVAYFPEPPDLEALATTLGAAPGVPEGSLSAPRAGATPDDDWLRIWKRGFEPIPVGERLLVLPSWKRELADGYPGRVCIQVDPGMAFGTGTHETTRLCLEWLDAAWHGGALLDVGTGTGILAIAALLLEPESNVMAIDVDPVAVDVARENARDNGVGDRIAFEVCGPEAVDYQFHVVLANLTADAILAVRDALVARVAPEGTLVLSGVLGEQVDDVVAAMEGVGLALESRREAGEWAALVMRAR